MRYIVNNVDEAIDFYTQRLAFKVDFHPAPGFAALSKDNFKLYLNQPGAGGAGQTMNDGAVPAPGGWNRFQIEVEDLGKIVDELKRKGARFRSDIIIGQGGKQALLQDPSGNLIELFEAKSN
jgi:catechol 2,3-dioxygenase-like lactoylglutathione lyase family enzyme